MLLEVCCLAMPSIAQEDQDCLLCHGEPDAIEALEDGTTRSLYVDANIFEHSVHGAFGCMGCHGDIEELPHAANLPPVACGTCHDQAEQYVESLHGRALKNGDTDAATCSDCHAKHNIVPAAAPLSPVSPQNIVQTFGRCHADPQLTRRHMISVLDPTDVYLKSVHGRVREGEEFGLAATCIDCHGTHTMQPAHESAANVSPQNIPSACGACHAEILEEFSGSIHGQALRAGISDAPDCTDCHGEHGIIEHASEGSPVAMQEISRSTCVQCHNDKRIMNRYGLEVIRSASYMDSYHGIAVAGAETVANCTSCHGVHGILGQADSNSSVHPANLPQTCAQCHENADENFASVTVHTIATSNGQWMLDIVRFGYI